MLDRVVEQAREEEIFSREDTPTDQRVEVASGVALDVRAERLPGRPGHLRSPPRSRGVRRSVRSRPRR